MEGPGGCRVSLENKSGHQVSYLIYSFSTMLWGTRNMPNTLAGCWQRWPMQSAQLFPSWSLLADERDGG